MVQDLRAKVQAKGGIWIEAKVKAGWVGQIQQDPVEIVFVQTAGTKPLISPGNPVMKKAVLSVARK